MIELVITFLVLAIIAGLLGFTGVEVISIDIARTLFFLFLILFVLSLLWNMFSGRKGPM
ncbi:MAG TPA: DUF1328 family protein [Candidatus Babeliales bacterium]|nr:DUF1328 family protein [Candidatus Babeliales bacterium]